MITRIDRERRFVALFRFCKAPRFSQHDSEFVLRDGVSGVRVGKSIRFEIETSDHAAAEGEVEELCKRFLTNPVIEDASIELTEIS